MVPSASRILSRRHAAMVIVRFAGLGLLVAASIPLIFAVVRAFLWGGIGHLFSEYDGVVHVARSASWIIPALTVLLLGKPLVKWLVPLPRVECPKCGYTAQHLREPRCPECGVSLPEEFVETGASGSGAETSEGS